MTERSPDPSPLLRAHARMEAVALDEHSRREAAIEMLRQRRRPDPDDFVAREPKRRWDAVAVTTRLMLAVGVAASLGFVIYHFVTTVPQETESAIASVRASLVGRAPPDHQPAAKPARRLVLTELSGAANRPVALGVTIEGPPQGAAVLVRGLPAKSRITAGTAAPDGTWRIPASDLARAAVVPPPDYVGLMNLSIDLALADGTVADSDVLRLRWTATLPEAITPKPVRTTTIAPDVGIYPAANTAPPPAPPSAVAPPAPSVAALPPAPSAVAPPAPSAPSQPPTPPAAEREPNQPTASPARQLDPEEIATLLQRGQVYLENGDISAARPLLRRAAEAGDVRATLALARTYDPVVLKQLGALGATADIAKARAWYQKASELGSAEAVMRLQRLAQEAR
jgi:hypothetical protein